MTLEELYLYQTGRVSPENDPKCCGRKKCLETFVLRSHDCPRCDYLLDVFNEEHDEERAYIEEVEDWARRD